MIDKRLKEVVAYSGLTDSAFARKINTQQMTLWRQLNGARKVSLDTIMAVAQQFPEINANWLLRGTGAMLGDTEAQDKRLENLIDVIAMQQETIKNLQEKIKQLQNK